MHDFWPARTDANGQDMEFHAQFTQVVEKSNAEVVRILIQHGADVTARDETHSTPLHLAASSAFTGSILRLLLSHGPNVGAKDDRGRTPFQIASARGLSEIAELLYDV
jgi:ankyrin repeat protein